jgi:hypothetical protein
MWTTTLYAIAVVDASDGCIKRVASGVEEESIAISFVHKLLQE